MEKAIPEFLQYGAVGILAMAFLVMLVLFIRADKRAQLYAGTLKEASFDRSQLIAVVSQNTRANTLLAERLKGMNESQDRMATVMAKLDKRLDDSHCPFAPAEEDRANPRRRTP